MGYVSSVGKFINTIANRWPFYSSESVLMAPIARFLVAHQFLARLSSFSDSAGISATVSSVFSRSDSLAFVLFSKSFLVKMTS